MDDIDSLNGHAEALDARGPTSNPYVDLLNAKVPPDVLAFELNSDPYANMIPPGPAISPKLEDFDGEPYRSHPGLVLRAVSAVFLGLFVFSIVVAGISFWPH